MCAHLLPELDLLSTGDASCPCCIVPLLLLPAVCAAATDSCPASTLCIHQSSMNKLSKGLAKAASHIFGNVQLKHLAVCTASSGREQLQPHKLDQSTLTGAATLSY